MRYRVAIGIAVGVAVACGLYYGYTEGVRAVKAEKAKLMYRQDRNLHKYFKPIVKASYRFGISPYLVASVINAETGFTESSVSGKGARGIAQVMPETGRWIARELDVKYKPSDTYQNILFCAFYLKESLIRYNGNVELAVASYNCGEGNVRHYKEIPETRAFVKRVMKCFKRYKKVYGEE